MKLNQTLPPARKLLKQLSLRAKKRFGQNFLTNTEALKECLASLQISKGDAILEIGAGLGHFTEIILPLSSQSLHIIEKDHDLINHLSTHFGDHVTLHNIDVRSDEFTQLIALYKPQYVVGNLPYYLATTLIEKLLTKCPQVKKFGFMLQYEVGQKYCASAGEKNNGYLAFLANCFSDVTPVKVFPAEDFYPAPKVDSIFVTFTRHPAKPLQIDSIDKFLPFLRTIFQAPRKKLLHHFKSRKESYREFLQANQLKEDLRPHQLTLEQAHHLFKIMRENS